MYNFDEKEKNVFEFTSNAKFLYKVIFSAFDFAFPQDNTLGKNAYELSIEIDKRLEKLPPKDLKIEPTIVKIVETFFIKEPSNFAIFHIATFDKKAPPRKRLFASWFEKNNNNFLENTTKA